MNLKLAHEIKSNAFSTKEQSLHYQQIEKYLSARLYSALFVRSTVPCGELF